MCSRTAVSCIPRVYSELERTCVMLGIILTCRSFIRKLANKHRCHIHWSFCHVEASWFSKSHNTLIWNTLSVSHRRVETHTGGPSSLSWPVNTFAFHEASWLWSPSASEIHQLHFPSHGLCLVIIWFSGYSKFWRREREMYNSYQLPQYFHGRKIRKLEGPDNLVCEKALQFAIKTNLYSPTSWENRRMLLHIVIFVIKSWNGFAI